MFTVKRLELCRWVMGSMTFSKFECSWSRVQFWLTWIQVVDIIDIISTWQSPIRKLFGWRRQPGPLHEQGQHDGGTSQPMISPIKLCLLFRGYKLAIIFLISYFKVSCADLHKFVDNKWTKIFLDVISKQDCILWFPNLFELSDTHRPLALKQVRVL